MMVTGIKNAVSCWVDAWKKSPHLSLKDTLLNYFFQNQLSSDSEA